MAEPQLFIYEVEDSATGQVYEIEGPEGTSEEELSSFIAAQNQAQSPATEGVAPQVLQPQGATPSGVQQPQEGRDPTAFEAGMGRDVATIGALSERDRPDIREAYEGLYASGVRDPAQFNALRTQFAGVSPDQLPEITGADIVQLQERDAYYKARNMAVPGMFTATEQTGMEDAVKPEDSISAGIQGIKRGLGNMANSAVGLAGVGADIVGADETADSLLTSYIDNNAKIALNYPAAVPTVQDIESMGDFAMFVSETLGELAPQLTAAFGAGGLGASAANRLATKSAVEFVEDRVAQGVTREFAEQEAIALIRKKTLQGATAGTGAFSVGQETGATYGNTYQETGEKAPWLSLATGTISGALDTVLPASVIKKIGGTSIPKAFEAGVLKRVAKEGAKGFAMEGGTEALQEFVTSLPAAVITGESPFTADMLDKMVNAFVKGAIGGTAISAGTTALTTNVNAKPPTLEELAPLESTITAPTGGRKTKKYAAGLSQATEQVVTRVNNLTEGWAEAPTITVHDNFNDLDGVDNDAVGVFLEDGTVAINTEAVISQARLMKTTPDAVVAAVTYHESLGHYGLAKQFGADLDAMMTEFYSNSDSIFKDKVDTWLKKNPTAYEGRSFREELATEEVLAEMSEKGELPVAIMDKVKNLIKDTIRKIPGATMKYSDREIKAILGMAHQAVVKGNGRDVISTLAGNKNMMTGLQGNQKEVDGFYESPEPYYEAVMRGEQGEDVGPSSQVRKETGWFIGPDRRWRMEVDDSNANYNLDFSSAPKEGYTLDEVIDHPALFEMYPNLREIRVIREAVPGDKDKRYQGWFDDEINTINVTPYASDPKGTLLHEIQHWIQDKEGFSGGGTDKSALRNMPDKKLQEVAKKVAKYHTRLARKHLIESEALKEAANNPLFTAFSDAANKWSKLNEVSSISPEALAAQSKMYEAQDRLAEYYLGTSNTRAESVSDTDRAQFYMLLMQADSPDGAKTGLMANANLAAADSRKQAIKAKTIETVKDNPSRLRVVLGDNEHLPFQAYMHMFGEVEARDTAKRRERSEYQRKEEVPYTSEPEIEPNDYIFDSGMGPRESVNLPSNDNTNSSPAKKAAKYREDAKSSRAQALKNRKKGDIDRAQNWEAQALREEELAASFAETSLQSNNKYMRAKSLEEIQQLSQDNLTPDELFDSMNAYDILDKMSQAYTPEPMSDDTIKAEAELRGFTAQNFLRTNPKEAGNLSRRLVMYDIAAEKLNEKITGLYSKIQSGQATPDTAAEYAKTLVRFEELTSRMFGEQSEIGRALRTIQNLNYTRRRTEGLKNILGGVTEKDLADILSDPETLAKFAMDIQGQIAASAERMKGSTFKSVATNILNVPRALMSSMDLSAPLRQGIFFVGRKEFYSSFVKMFKYFGSESAYKSMMFDITQHPNYSKMSKANLAFSNAYGSLSQKEEDFMTNYADWVPGVKRSERAYTGFLTKLRVDTFNNLLSKYEEAGIDVNDPKMLKDLARFINSATGRGDLGKLSSAAPQLNALFFSPRLIAARVNMLDPTFYTGIPGLREGLHPTVRKEAVKSLLSFGTIAMTVMTLAVAAGMDVEDDPRSTDFGRLRDGNTRYDILGGFGQYITLGARIATSQKMTGQGAIRELNSDEYRAETRGDVVGKFFTNKFAPVTSYLWGYLEGKDAVGEDFVPTDQLVQRMTPMFLGDLTEVVQEYGWGPGIAKMAPGFFGVGVQDYASRALDPTVELKAPVTLKREGFEDEEAPELSIKDGVVTLKEATRNEWTQRINDYVQGWMAEEMADPTWATKTDVEKAEIIADVREEARDSAKADMEEVLGL